MKPPKPPQKKSQTCFHGLIRQDDFAWLKADNWQEILQDSNALPHNIRAYLEAENLYADNVLKPVATLTETLLQEMKARILDEDQSVKIPDGDFAYFYKFSLGQEYPSFFRIFKGDEQSRQLLLDADQQAEKYDFFKLGSVCHSDDHLYLAWSSDIAGGEYYTIHIRDLATGKDIDHIQKSDGDCVWVGHLIFYIHVNDQHRSDAVYCHQLGTAQDQDRLVWREDNPAFFLSISKALSGDYLFINAYDHDSCEIALLSTHQLERDPQIVKPRQRGVEYYLEHDKPRKRFFVLTNQDAIDFKIMLADEANPHQSQEFIPHQTGIYILDVIALQDYLIRLERIQGLPRLIICNLQDQQEYAHTLSQEPHDLTIEQGFMYKAKQFYIHYSSMRQPEQVFEFDAKQRTQTLRKTQKIGGGHQSEDYRCERIFAPAEDGEQIPLSILYHKDTPPDGKRPFWLYGYGAYGITTPPKFSSMRLSLIKRGWSFAIAHIRGGSAKGRSWYFDGKLERKTNSFTDFIACARHLIHIGYAKPGFITAQGGSAGGMLMGAVANLAPELFCAIIAQVPFVDVLSTMLDDSLPLTPPEWLEWGNPITQQNAYCHIAAYSPYENVQSQPYPWILATSGLSDPRVGYWEPAKWIAKLRLAQTSKNPICLKTDMSSGHGGKQGRFQSLDEIANIYSFALLAHNLHL